MKEKETNLLFKINAVLILILCALVGVDLSLIYFSQTEVNTKFENIRYRISDEEPTKTLLNTYNSYDLSFEFNNFDVDSYPLGEEVSCFDMLLKAYNYNDFNIDNFYEEYLEYTHQEANTIEGRMPPKDIYSLFKQYIKDNDLSIQINNISYAEVRDLQQIIKNNWPAIVWYGDNNEDININDRWQFANIGILYKIDDNFAYLMDPRDEEIKIEISKFINMWVSCGHYAIVI